MQINEQSCIRKNNGKLEKRIDLKSSKQQKKTI